jgi:hypothetical protein
MADIVIANDDLVVLGGPSSINLELDIGAAGNRGSLIFTDAGKPTAPNISFETSPQINDLYINLNPSDNEYLYLYQYKLDNAVLGWTKILRLVPNTVLANPVLKFINGEAHTALTVGGTTFFARGLYFPMAGTLENAETESLDYRDINLQYTIASNKQVASAAELKTIDTTFDIELFNGTGYTTQTVNLGSRFLYGTLKAAEWDGTNTTAITGYRKVDVLATVGGRSEQVMDIVQVTPTDGATFPGSVTVPSHGLSSGNVIAYLANGNAPIVGLTDQAEYVVGLLVPGDEDNSFTLFDTLGNPVILTNPTVDGVQSMLKFGGLV